MTELLDGIDRLLDGLCPCGAEPRDGSAYCSDDCTPTHVGDHTDQRESGDYATPMRWRPDLVTAHDDSELTEVDTFRAFGHIATVYRRASGDWHYRLDDGNRYVGLDVAERPDVTPRDDPEPWYRLERELTDSRRIEPDPVTDPWGAVWFTPPPPSWHVVRHASGSQRLGVAEDSARPGETVRVVLNGSPVALDPFHLGAAIATAWSDATSNPLDDMRQFLAQREVIFRNLDRQMNESAAALRPVMERAAVRIRQAAGFVVTPPPAEPAHPMLTAIEARRNRNTGPERRQRTPRQINPRRGR